jgi:hypothetical protein
MGYNTSELIQKVEDAVKIAENPNTPLPENIKKLEGMSGTIYRKFINNLVKSCPNAKYMEIGCWKGSTAISALHNNLNTVKDYLIIDNWKEFGGPKNDFKVNFKSLVGQEPKLMDADCFSLDVKQLELNDVDIYFYDGAHSELDQEKAVTHFASIMSKNFVLIVDDYNWGRVVSGTYKGIRKANITVKHEVTKFTNENGVKDTWWNGIGIFVLEKN